MRNPLTIESFADWLGKQPAEKWYDWSVTHKCALGQYVETFGGFGTQDENAAGAILDGWRDSSGQFHEYPDKLFDIAVAHPSTFGAAHARALSYLRSEVV